MGLDGDFPDHGAYWEEEHGSAVKLRRLFYPVDEQGSALNLRNNERSAEVKMEGPLDTIYSRLTPDDTIDALADISTVYADLDGTMLPAGAVNFSEETLEALDRFHQLGGRIVFVTGKSLTEVKALIKNTPSHIPLEIVVEKGAYYITRIPGYEEQEKPLLVKPEMRREIIKMKSDFNKLKVDLEKKYGVKIVPAGDGQHQTVVSIDIVDPELHGDKNRTIDKVKIKDKELLKYVKLEIERWLSNKYGLGKFVLVDLGNSNFEIGFPSIDKPEAINHQEASRKDHGSALVIGDSGNDLSMLAFTKTRQKIYAGAVVHDNTPQALIDEATFCVRGEGNGAEFLKKIIDAKTRGDGRRIIATNTGPFRVKDGKTEICEGMPVAFYELVKNMDDGVWVYVGNEIDPPDQSFIGKLTAVPISEELRDAHYRQISNGVFWQVAHKPESDDPVGKFPESAWAGYEEVCHKVAGAINNNINNSGQSTKKTTIWVQDYQMLAVAEKLKQIRPREDFSVGLYWHIPFPEAQVFVDELGEEKAIRVLRWFSDYHMIGFHTENYASNYQKACQMLGVDSTQVIVQPISVNVDEIAHTVSDLSRNGITFDQEGLDDLFQTVKLRAGVQRECEFVLCGIERCDDTKATIERLEAWKDLARRKPELFVGRQIVEVIVESRTEIKAFADRHRRAMRLIEETNEILEKAKLPVGKRALPIEHLKKIHSRGDVLRAMAASDIVIAGLAKKDGYNMSATEAACVQTISGKGCLLVSENIGFETSLEEHGLENAINVLRADANGAITSECISTGFEKFFTGSPNITAHCAIGMGEYFQTYNFRAWIGQNLEGINRAKLFATIRPFVS